MFFTTRFKFLSYICPTQEANPVVLNTNALYFCTQKLLLFQRKAGMFMVVTCFGRDKSL